MFSLIENLLICGCIILSERPFPGLLVNGQVLSPVEANSSPSHIIVTKGSSVQLHWNYTYIGDGTYGPTAFTYKEQIIGWNSTSQLTVQTLAKRTGANGALRLESPTPAPFNGRIEVISSNSTLVIRDLQYNDSARQLSSFVTVDGDFGGARSNSKFHLKPVVSIAVNGIPGFIARPPSALGASEGSHLQLTLRMDVYPKPSADFRWPHLISSSPTNVPSVQLYPFVYSSTYTLNKIDASYCGRILQTTLKNIIGSSTVTASTNVTVLLKFDMDFGLKARKIRGARCVEVQWKKVEAGACYVKYEVVLRNASGGYQYSDSGYNIGEMTMCSFATFSNVTDVQLTVSFKATSTNVTANVSDTQIGTPTPTPTDSGSTTGVIVGASVGGVIFLIVVMTLIIWLIKKRKRSSSTDYPPQEDNYAMDAEVNQSQPLHPAYTHLNESTLIYGKLGESTKDRPNHRRGKTESDYADVKVDGAGYPAVGPCPQHIPMVPAKGVSSFSQI